MADIVEVFVILEFARNDVARIDGFRCSVVHAYTLVALGKDSHIVL